ncbi:hypothetical protein [Maliponia aquimaris]|uniref:Cyanovirin-N domain-containing protein n=1 Tax=Maliponia aquimaris TaxID=1673631 RepID=A0A238JQQ8_9RHOB|nr:hypothetical protein [Maliponia aquimaris]SMX32990.1 hypothetical protein MAA8898_00372 [Maliponia aquimaris]
MAASTFQNTCSNITLGYGADGGTMISATCLKADGMPNATSIAVPAIGSTDGTLSN